MAFYGITLLVRKLPLGAICHMYISYKHGRHLAKNQTVQLFQTLKGLVCLFFNLSFKLSFQDLINKSY